MFDKVHLLFLAVSLATSALAQPPAPVATYKLHAPGALKDDEGLKFNWAVAPDNSLLISFGQRDGQWAIKRITSWETRTPREETLTFPHDAPDRHDLLNEMIVDPSGRYLLVLPGPYRKPGASGGAIWEEAVAVIDLRTFRLASIQKSEGDIETNYLFFDRNGILILARGFARATALSLPELKPLATCNLEDAPIDRGKGGFVTASPAGDSCATLLSMAHASTFLQLFTNRPPNPKWTRAVAGPDCAREALNKAGNLEVDRCGTVHFADPDGVFNTTFWHALKVVSIPDGKTIISLPLHFYDGSSSGVFAQADGHDYLIVRHGLTLLTYRLP